MGMHRKIAGKLTGRMTKWLVLVAWILAVGVAGGYFFVTTGALPAGQDTKPSELEEWAAKTSLGATIRREALGLRCPVQPILFAIDTVRSAIGSSAQDRV